MCVVCACYFSPLSTSFVFKSLKWHSFLMRWPMWHYVARVTRPLYTPAVFELRKNKLLSNGQPGDNFCLSVQVFGCPYFEQGKWGRETTTSVFLVVRRPFGCPGRTDNRIFERCTPALHRHKSTIIVGRIYRVRTVTVRTYVRVRVVRVIQTPENNGLTIPIVQNHNWH